MSPGAVRRLHGAGILLCLPLAAIGALTPANEYAAADPAMVGAVDCDGPMSVLMFAIPALAFYTGSAVVLFRTRERAPRWHVGMGLFCLIIGVAVLPNIVRAFIANEQNKTEQTCS